MLALAAGIFLLSAQPGSPTPELPFPHADKVAHAGVYGLLGLSLLRALARSAPARGFRFRALVTSLACLLYGVSDEFHQTLVPYRSPDPLDVVADVAGALLACLLVWLWPRRLAPRPPAC